METSGIPSACSGCLYSILNTSILLQYFISCHQKLSPTISIYAMPLFPKILRNNVSCRSMFWVASYPLLPSFKLFLSRYPFHNRNISNSVYLVYLFNIFDFRFASQFYLKRKSNQPKVHVDHSRFCE